MSVAIIDGRTLSKGILEKLQRKISRLEYKPSLAILLVGSDPASIIYVNVKKKACEKIGMGCEVYRLRKNITQKYLVNKIHELNSDRRVSGIILQLPLPQRLNVDEIVDTIDKKKDVDGLTTDSSFIPATAKAVLKALESTNLTLNGKRATVIGRSKLVGMPVANLLRKKGCKVKVCHSQTKNLKSHTKNADVLVSAVGKKGLVTKDMVKKGVVVIDVGITRLKNQLYGDVSDDVKDVASYITPVPGGIGPLTVACLLENVVFSLTT